MKILFLITLLFTSVYINVSLSQEKKEEFKPTFKPWAYAFGDFFYKIGGDTLKSGFGEFAKTDKDFYAFTFRRVYLGLDASLLENVNGQIILEGSDLITYGTGERGMFIKAAYIEWKNAIPRASIIIGQSPTPSWSTLTEKVWSYRSIEKTVADFRGFTVSNDLGLAIGGNFDKKGNYGYYLMFGNGRGPRPENDRYKKYYADLNGRFLDKKIIVDAYSDYQYETHIKRKTTLKGFLAYQSEKITAAFEGAYQIQKAYYTADSTNIMPYALSFYVHGTILKDKLRGFARYDYYDPDTKFDTSRNYSDKGMYYKENFFTAGLDWTPNAYLHIMPNIWVTTYSDKREGINKIDRKADVVARATFWFILK